MLIVLSFSMSGYGLYNGISQSDETIYQVSVEQKSVTSIGSQYDDIGSNESQYDITVDELSPKSKLMYDNVKSETPFGSSQKYVEYSELPPQQILDEPVICDNCSTFSDINSTDEDPNIQTGISGSIGYYQVEVDSIDKSQNINYTGIAFWGIIGFINLLLLIGFILKEM